MTVLQSNCLSQLSNYKNKNHVWFSKYFHTKKSFFCFGKSDSKDISESCQTIQTVLSYDFKKYIPTYVKIYLKIVKLYIILPIFDNCNYQHSNNICSNCPIVRLIVSNNFKCLNCQNLLASRL